MIKIRYDNNVSDHTGTIYVENESKLSWPIGSGAINDKNQTRQLGDQSYNNGLHKK